MQTLSTAQPTAWSWHKMCIGETIILGIPGAVLTSYAAIDLDAKINNRATTILGVVYTLLALISSALAGEDDTATAAGSVGGKTWVLGAGIVIRIVTSLWRYCIGFCLFVCLFCLFLAF